MLFGKMALQVTRVVQHAENLDPTIPAAVDDDMPGTGSCEIIIQSTL
jgi:hypothetical protein